MTNDISDTNLEEVIPCFALSKNDSYVMSASGAKISLFSMATFKVKFVKQASTFYLSSMYFYSVSHVLSSFSFYLV